MGRGRGRGGGKRPWANEHRELDAGWLRSVPHSENGPGGLTYQVRQVGGGVKTYTCPGCLRAIPVGVPHVVAWPEAAPFGTPQGLDARRHWHTECWRRRLRPS